jgi:hypothetical protein
MAQTMRRHSGQPEPIAQTAQRRFWHAPMQRFSGFPGEYSWRVRPSVGRNLSPAVLLGLLALKGRNGERGQHHSAPCAGGLGLTNERLAIQAL